MNWHRVTKRHPCPVCGKPDWCLVSPDGMAAICPRTAEGAAGEREGAGYLHRLGEAAQQPRRQISSAPPPSTIDAPEYARIFEAASTAMHRRGLAGRLGVTEQSLMRLNIGWSETLQASAFPMRNDRAEVIGIRLRNAEGRKWAIKGSHSGLFLPQLANVGPLLICEGPTDTAAMLDLGFDVIGRPSCNGGARLIVRLLTRTPRYNEIAIMADADGPGLDGAYGLVVKLAKRKHRSVRVCTPPAKDVRQWKIQGARKIDVQNLISSTREYNGLKAATACPNDSQEKRRTQPGTKLVYTQPRDDDTAAPSSARFSPGSAAG